MSTQACTQVPIEHATPGMILADDLRTTRGNLLLAAGTVLTKDMITSLSRHEIESVPVADRNGGESKTDGGDKAGARELAAKRLERLFRKSGGNDAARALLERVRRYRSGDPS